jgi:hypothetical protein
MSFELEETKDSDLTVGRATKAERAPKQPAAARSGIIPELPGRWLFSGPSGSGKSNLARWILEKYLTSKNGKSWFKEVHLFSPTAGIDKTWSGLPGLRKANEHTDLNPKVLGRIFEAGTSDVKRLGKDKAPHRLCIFDDAIADTKFLNSKQFFQNFIAGRHGNVTSIIMSQSYVKVPRSVRLQMTAVFFMPSIQTEIIRLQEEAGPPEMSKQEFIDMVEVATQPTKKDPYPFFMIDRLKPIQHRYRKNLDQSFTIKAAKTSVADVQRSAASREADQAAVESASRASRVRLREEGESPEEERHKRVKRALEEDE